MMEDLNRSEKKNRLHSSKMATLLLGVSLGLQTMVPADAITLPALLPEAQSDIPQNTVTSLFAMQALPQPHQVASAEVCANQCGAKCGSKCGAKCGSKCGAHACGAGHTCGTTPPTQPPGNPGGTGGPTPGGPGTPNPPATGQTVPPGLGGLFPSPPPVTRSTLPPYQCALVIANDRVLGSPRALSYLNNYPCSYVVMQSTPLPAPIVAEPVPVPQAPVVEIPVAAPPPPPVVLPPPVEKTIPVRGYW